MNASRAAETELEWHERYVGLDEETAEQALTLALWAWDNAGDRFTIAELIDAYRTAEHGRELRALRYLLEDATNTKGETQ